MAKPGFLKILEPIAALGAAVAAPEILPGLTAAAPEVATVGDIGPAATTALLNAPETVAGTAASLGTTALAPEALAGVGDVTGLLSAGPGVLAAAGEALPGLAGVTPATATAGTAGGDLLAAGPAATAPAATAPLTTPVAGPLGAQTGIGAATSASPMTAAANVPADVVPGGGVSDIAALGPGGTGPVNANMLTADFGDAGTLTPPPGVTGTPTQITPNLAAAEPTYEQQLIQTGGIGADTAPGSIGGIAPGGVAGTSTVAPDFTAAVQSAEQAGFPEVADYSGGGAGGIGDFASKAGDYLLAHPGLPITGLLAGSTLLRGNPAYPAEASLNQLAAQGGSLPLTNLATSQQGTATELTTPITTGILPPGAEANIDAATNARIATTRSAYGNLGLTGSTMEADAIGQIKADKAAQQNAVAESLLQQGAQYSNLAGSNLGQAAVLQAQDYATILRTQLQQDQNYQNALYNFARALSGAGYAPTQASAQAAAASA